MTASNTVVDDIAPVIQYTATSGQTTFDAPWLFFEDVDLTVYHTLSGATPDDTTDILTLTTDYTVTNTDTENGGAVVLNTGAATGDTITIYRIVTLERKTDYQSSGDMLSETLNKEQDTEMMALQQLRSDFARSVSLRRSEDAAVDPTLPTPTKSKVIGWDSTGKNLKNYSLNEGTDDAGNTNYTPSGTGAIERTVENRLNDIVSIKNFGAVVDGATDDTAAINLCEASEFDLFYVPEGGCLTTLTNFNSLTKKYVGPGKIITTAGNIAHNFSRWNGAPSSTGTPSSLLTAFDGDSSGSIHQTGQSVTGATMGTPATGYDFVLETAPYYTFTHFDSGHNEETAGNDGRTGYIQNKKHITHDGDGDAIVHHASVTVTGQKAGATHFLASPAGVLYGGAITAGADYTNLTLGEISLSDAGYDCRGTGFVINFTRNNSTGANNNFWNGMRLISNGTEECEACCQVVGGWNIGLDLTPATIGGVGVALKQSQKIEFHAEVTTDAAGVNRYADTFNNWDMQYNGSAIAIRAAGSNKVLITETAITLANAPVTISDAGGANLTGTDAGYKVAGLQIIEERKTGWTSPTGTATRTGFATSTATTTELAETLKALIDDLTTHGLIGS